MASMFTPEDPEGVSAPESGTPTPADETAQPPATTVASRYYAFQVSEAEVQRRAEIFAANLKNEPISQWDLPRVTQPAGEIPQWRATSQDGSVEYVSSVAGIILNYTSPRAYWPSRYGVGAGTPPTCSSPDGVTGYSTQEANLGGDCAACPMNQWGSDPETNAKACKEKRLVFILEKDKLLPTIIQVPATSLQSFRGYMLHLSTGDDPVMYSEVETEFTLHPVEKGSSKYLQVALKQGARLNEAEIQRVQAFSQHFVHHLSKTELSPDVDLPQLKSPAAAE